MQELYSNYLVSQNHHATAVGLAKILPEHFTHDRITRLLNNRDYDSRDLWQKVKKNINKDGKIEEGVLIFDDTISEKPHSKTNEIINWQYDHAKGKYSKGINIITCFYKNEQIQLPVGFEIVNKEITYLDSKTGKTKRKSIITKNEHFRKHLSLCASRNLPFKYVLADSWYCSKENIKYINELGKKFVIGIKSNRLISMYEIETNSWSSHSQLKHTKLESNRPYLVKLNGVDFPVILLKKVFKNGDGSVGILYLVSNDLELNEEALYKLYKKRWSIEVYHRDLKNHTSLSKSPTKTVRSQSNHIYMSIFSYCRLELLRIKSNNNNQQAIKELLLIKANKAAWDELIKVQKLYKVCA